MYHASALYIWDTIGRSAPHIKLTPNAMLCTGVYTK